MDDTLQKALRKATQNARHLLEDEFEEQLDGRFDIRPDGTIPDEPGPHLDARERLLREKLVTAIGHREAGGMGAEEAVATFLREAAFTTLNRFVALKMLEERGVVKECISEGQQSSGFKEFTMLAPGLSELSDGGYRLYLESLFDEIGQEVKVLFDRDVVAGRLWPRRPALEELLEILNKDALADAWQETEAIGWVYQYFNTDSERGEMREDSRAPRNSHEMAVRNQFFTPHYVVQFLTDNTLGRTWHEMQEGDTRIRKECDYFAERADEVFLDEGEAPPESSSSSSNALSDVEENGESGASVEASHEEDDEGPTHVPYRAKKDPRELKILDPACGSGHFLLYAFDLLWTIYEEAWEDPKVPAFEETGQTLSDDYESLDDLHSALPGLILEKNLYGVDIDPRATQIASFALWMRAQEAYSEVDLARDERPAITKTNVVVAEPMPGDEELREEFVESLQPPALGQLVDAVFEKMELADEAGTLLRIEEEIRDAIQEAKKQWEQPKQLELLPKETRQEFRQAGLFDVSNISDEEFWSSVEEQIYRALEGYAEQGEQQDGLRRQLFADDAAAGFAFVDLCRQHYDVVLMNPPFGEPAESTESYIDEQYPDSKNDILQAFVERAEEHLRPAGYLGAITSRTSFFLSMSQSWRERVVLHRYRPQVLADFGVGVLDATVETAAYVFRALNENERSGQVRSLLSDLKQAKTSGKGKFSVPKYIDARSDDLKRHQAERELERLLGEGLIVDASSHYAQYKRRTEAIRQFENENSYTAPPTSMICLRLLEADKKDHALKEALRKTRDERRYRADPATFVDVPGAPFAYWVSDRVRRLFKELPSFESNDREVRAGVQTSDDFRFVRCWWEVPASERCRPEVHPEKWEGAYCVRSHGWFPFVKGGSYKPFHANISHVLNWRHDGRELKAWASQLYGNSGWSRIIKSTNFYFRPGFTWPRRTKRFCPKPVPRGAIFSNAGQCGFVGKNLTSYIGLLGSKAFQFLITLHLGTSPQDQGGSNPQFETGMVRKSPVPKFEKKNKKLSNLFIKSYMSEASVESQKEKSLWFRSIVSIESSSVDETYNNLEKIYKRNFEKRNRIQKKIDRVGYDLYDISDRDREVIEETVGIETGDEDEKFGDAIANHDLFSYALGCAFGRWDIRYVTGERELPSVAGPFEPLPVCPSGMLTGEENLPMREAPDKYPLSDVPADGILLDDPGHDRDVLSRMRSALGFMFEDEDTAEREVCDLLGESDLRRYFRKTTGFFKAHRKEYSDGRRKAPIYWQLATQSVDYSVWLYYPKLTHDTFYRVLDLVKEKIRHEERQLSDLRQKSGSTSNSTQRTKIADQDDFVSELRGFRKEVERVAPLWNPNMSDGVVINHAPLWRLVQHNRSWQKDCKKHWDRLVEGEYDWSHWAMHLWPERVVPKCAERRDLAIAHDLEDVFWEQDAEGDWTARDEPTRPVEELVEERTSRTVKSALEDLLDAPPPR